MKWYKGLILFVLLLFGASASQGQWKLLVHKGGAVEEHVLADVDSLTFRYDTPAPTGSCCLLNGSCAVTTQAACTGLWTADGVCVPNSCVQPTGSCCALDGTCTEVTQANCTGAWTTGGTCTPNPCPPPTGSCCAPVGTCTVTTQAACTGVWTAAGTCVPNLCPLPPQPSMVLIPAGAFNMGSPTNEPGRSGDETQHQVTLTKAIYVSTYEVTQSEWQTVMGWNDSSFQGALRPVESVTWYDALRYCNQRSTLDGYTPAYTITGATYSGNHITGATVAWNQAANGYRLLTEAEWEYACRATSTAAFCNGAITNFFCLPLDPNLDQVGWYCGNASNATHEVGGKTVNTWGLADTHGNVWEWCWDLYGAYSGDAIDPTGPVSGFARVTRGGAWDRDARNCRSATRGGSNFPEFRYYFLGVRIARTAP